MTGSPSNVIMFPSVQSHRCPLTCFNYLAKHVHVSMYEPVYLLAFLLVCVCVCVSVCVCVCVYVCVYLTFICLQGIKAKKGERGDPGFKGDTVGVSSPRSAQFP